MSNFFNYFIDANPLFYFFIVMLIFAFGDFLGILTKAKISSVFVVMFLFLLGFMAGILPADIIEKAGLTQFSSISAAVLIFHMGTMINLNQLFKEWRTVVTAVCSMIIVMISAILLIPLLGKETAIVLIPVLNGGIIATQIMSAAAAEHGLHMVAAFAAILYAVKKFAGAYPASLVGIKEANRLLADYRKEQATPAIQTDKNETIHIHSGFAARYNKYFTDFTCLMIAICFAWLSVSLGGFFSSINYSIWALLFGATLGYYNIVPTKILEKGKASGVFSMLVYVTIIPSLAKVSFDDLMTLGGQILLTLIVTIAMLYLIFYLLPGWKLLKSKNLAFGVSLCQYLGFPATFLISNEIAKAVSENPDEQEYVLGKIMPSYVVAGMTTVTTLSIIVAGIFVNFL